MLLPSHILFPVDFSERCKSMRPSVAALARHFQAKVTLMHVIQIPTGWYGGAEEAFPVMFDVPAMIEDGRQQLKAFFGKPEGVCKIAAVVDHGDPATLITGYAAQNSVELIMMPTHGYGKFRSLLLGSVTAKVLHDSKCRVWTAVHNQDLGPEGTGHIRNMLCAVSGEPE